MSASNHTKRLLTALIFSTAAVAQRDPASKGREVTKLYADTCASCHGTEMTGGSAPSLVNGQWPGGGDDTSIARSIRERHTGLNVPGLESVNNAEVRGLVIFIRERAASVERAQRAENKPTLGAPVKSERATFKLEPVIETGLDQPWAIAFLPDKRMLVTERPGRLRIVEAGRLLPDVVAGVPPVYGGEGGLLDVAVHPRYSQPDSDWIYLSYGDRSPNGFGMTAILRGRMRNNALVDIQQIFKADVSHYRKGGMRFGSRLLFDGEGHLFFTIGDRASPGDEQDLSLPNGKIFRVNDDGSIPSDNPFVHHKGGALPGVWTYGHRNGQGLAFSPVTGDLWESEHGPRGGDELNIIRPGRNYGWPLVTFGMNYNGTPITDCTTQPGMEDSVTHWVPSIAASPIAFYTGDRIPQWKNNLFVGALVSQELRRLTVEGRSVTHQELLFKGIGRVRNLVNGPDGYLYIVFNQPARIERIAPAQETETSASIAR